MKKIILSIAALLLSTGAALAHSGGLDQSGCHAGTQSYHCHQSNDYGSPTNISPVDDAEISASVGDWIARSHGSHRWLGEFKKPTTYTRIHSKDTTFADQCISHLKARMSFEDNERLQYFYYKVDIVWRSISMMGSNQEREAVRVILKRTYANILGEEKTAYLKCDLNIDTGKVYNSIAVSNKTPWVIHMLPKEG